MRRWSTKVNEQEVRRNALPRGHSHASHRRRRLRSASCRNPCHLINTLRRSWSRQGQLASITSTTAQYTVRKHSAPRAPTLGYFQYMARCIARISTRGLACNPADYMEACRRAPTSQTGQPRILARSADPRPFLAQSPGLLSSAQYIRHQRAASNPPPCFLRNVIISANSSVVQPAGRPHKCRSRLSSLCTPCVRSRYKTASKRPKVLCAS